MSQLSKIKAALSRVADPVIRERLLMVQASYRKPFRIVADEFGCAHGKARYWRVRYDLHGLIGLHTKPRSGRPRRISEIESMKLRKVVRKHDPKQGWTTKRVRQLIWEETGVKYCERQVIRISQWWGLSQIKPRPMYAYSKKEDREAFLKKTSVT